MQYTVAVRTLCEFTAKTGDLDLRFTPSPTAQEGIAGHQAVTARRGAGYEREVSLQSQWKSLRVRGRADGYDAAANRLEEIKTHRGDLARQPATHRALHWAQARVYGWLLCEARGLERITLALVYYDVGDGGETVLEEEHDRASLQAFFEDQCGRFLAWAQQELAHRAARDAALARLAFPHDGFRTGQRSLAESVYRAAAAGRCLMAQAPTGIGKTIGTVFPVLKAMPAHGIDKLAFLSAKTPGRRLALDAFDRLAAGAGRPAMRVLELVAREKSCEHPDKACHGEACPLAKGFYDRLPAARAAALQLPAMDRDAVRTIGLAHAICPYWLTQELARWSDAIVGDYNHWFDASALLHALAQANGWRVAVLADEAHNLVERARGMYSAQLAQADLLAVRRSAPAPLKKPLDKLARAWSALVRGHAGQDYTPLTDLPATLLGALQQASAAVADHLAQAPHEAGGALQQFHFDALAFLRLAETFGEHSMADLALRPGRGRPEGVLAIRNLIPAPFLAPRFAAAHTTTLFSATLGPADWQRDTLGLPHDTVWIDVETPFSPEQLTVRVVRSISTRWADRARSVAPIVDLIARQYAAQPGNYLAFFSSFDYLRSVAARFREAHPAVPAWEQSRGMGEAEREAFLARFVPGGRGIGFAVLGGSFGEGIDLPGDRLVGAFIATLGLPQVNPVNEQMRVRMGRAFGAGYDYTYLYPGLQKVVQAAGRVIRTREDRGVVYLIDDRFARPEVRTLLPAWWDVAPAPVPARPG